jgi:hypothetical protein
MLEYGTCRYDRHYRHQVAAAPNHTGRQVGTDPQKRLVRSQQHRFVSEDVKKVKMHDKVFGRSDRSTLLSDHPEATDSQAANFRARVAAFPEDAEPGCFKKPAE